MKSGFVVGMGLLIVLLLVFLNGSENKSFISNKTQKISSESENTISIGDELPEPKALFELVHGHGLLESVRVRAMLPLEPNANAISGDIPFGGGFEPGADHLYSAKQSYSIPEDEEKVKAWTQQHFSDNGYREEGSGQSGSTKASEKTDFLTFRNKADSNFTVSVSFTKQNNKTLMEYALNYVYVPKRSDDSKILEKVEHISLSLGKPGQVSQAFAVKDQATIDTIIEHYNALPYPVGGIHGCLSDDGTRLNIKFTLAAGNKILAVENPACSDILSDGKFKLEDKTLALFNYLTKQKLVQLK
jgi:hypothetical protein